VTSNSGVSTTTTWSVPASAAMRRAISARTSGWTIVLMSARVEQRAACLLELPDDGVGVDDHRAPVGEAPGHR
jgi:hypothetical protein